MKHILYVLFLVVFAVITRSAQAAVIPLPTGPLPADGQTASTVHLWAPDYVAGDKYKIKPDKGRVGEVTVSPDGVLTFEFFPPKVTGPGVIGLEIKRTGAVKVDERIELPVVPPFEGRLDITFDPPKLLVGQGTALVRISPRTTTPQDAAGRRLVLSASVGTIDTPMPAGDGTWVARYTPPTEIPGPRTVIISAADASAPDSIFGWAPLTLKVKQTATLQVQPDANVMLTIGDKTFGPLKASPTGTAAFDVELDPAYPSGRVQAVSGTGQKVDMVVDLPRPEYDRIAFLPLAATAPADAKVPLAIRVAATDLAGNPTRDLPVIRVSRGVLSAVTMTRDPGVFEAVFTPPQEAGEVSFFAELGNARSTARVMLVQPMLRVDLIADPPELAKDKRDFKVTARVKDPNGTGVPGLPVVLNVEGATVVAKIKDNLDGTYTASYRMGTGDAKAVLSAAPPMQASKLNVYRLLLWASTNAAPADGISKVPVTVVALDKYGLPVPDVEVVLAVPRGDASVPPTGKTDSQGIFRTRLTVGQKPDVVFLRAMAAGLSADSALYQYTPGQPVSPNFPEGGDPARLQVLAQWRSAIPSLTVVREGVAAKAGPPAVVSMTTVPPYTTPGCAVLVTLRVTDANGNAISRAKPKVTSTLGTVGAVTDNGDGSYNLPVQLPPGQDGPITLTVTAGTATRSQTLPTFMSAMMQGAQPTAQPTAAAPQAAQPVVQQPMAPVWPGVQPAAPAATKAPRVKKDRSSTLVDRPRFRGQLGLAGTAHRYSQVAASDSGAPTNADYTNGDFLAGKIGGAPGADLRLLLQPLPKPFALDINFLGYLETVAVAGENVATKGSNLRGTLRYRGDLSDAVYWYGYGGVQRGSAITFEYTDDSRTAAQIVSHAAMGAALGAGAGLEAGKIWAELDAGFVATPAPSIWGFRLQGAYDISSSLYAFLAFSAESRKMSFTIEGTEDTIEVKDSIQPLMLGVGGVFR